MEMETECGNGMDDDRGKRRWFNEPTSLICDVVKVGAVVVEMDGRARRATSKLRPNVAIEWMTMEVREVKMR